MPRAVLRDVQSGEQLVVVPVPSLDRTRLRGEAYRALDGLMFGEHVVQVLAKMFGEHPVQVLAKMFGEHAVQVLAKMFGEHVVQVLAKTFGEHAVQVPAKMFGEHAVQVLAKMLGEHVVQVLAAVYKPVAETVRFSLQVRESGVAFGLASRLVVMDFIEKNTPVPISGTFKKSENMGLCLITQFCWLRATMEYQLIRCMMGTTRFCSRSTRFGWIRASFFGYCREEEDYRCSMNSTVCETLHRKA